jgi:hypothetical protein
MPGPYVPPAARKAADQARQTRARYQEAVSSIRRDRRTSQAQKRRELDALRSRYTDRMAELRRQRNDAYQAEEAAAIAKLLRPPLDVRDASLAQLAEEFDWAEVSGDAVLMKVVCALAFQRATPVPGDVATTLVERYVNQRLDNGSFLDADAAGGYQRWLDLRRSPEEVLAETAIYSTSDRPEPTNDPTPVDPRQAAADKIAELFPEGNGQP